MNVIVIGLGSNIEAPEVQLRHAVALLAESTDIRVIECSSVYRSAPMGPKDQPDFLNACVLIETALPPQALLKTLKGIEAAQGRTHTRRWGERCIDLDLLVYRGDCLNSDDLTLPHPGIEQRDFVLQPMLDLLGPSALLPSGRRLEDALQAVIGHELQRTDIELTLPTQAAS